MLRYALQTLRARKGGFIGAFLALFCAAALVTACGILLETGLRGTIGTERYAGAPVIVGGDQNVHQVTVKDKGDGKTKSKEKAKPLGERVWLPADTANTLGSLPAVRAALPEITFPAYAVTTKGQIVPGVDGKPSYGHAWTSAPLTPFTLAEGAAPAAANEVVVDRELARRAGIETGTELTVQATGTPRAYRVTGIAAPAGGNLEQQTSLFFSDGEAERLSGRTNQVAVVGVLPKPGVSTAELAAQVKKALTGTTAQVVTGGGTFQVVTGGERGPVEFLDAAKARIKLVSMGGAIGGTSLLVAVLVVVGTFALSIQQRYRELALLRAIAATPRQVRQLIGREALIVGFFAGVLGSLAGLPIAYWLHGRFVGFKTIPETLEVTFSVFPFFAAIGAALLGAWAAARISARRAARIRPAEALSEAAMEQRTLTWGRLGAGAAFLVGGVVLLAVLGSLRSEPASTPVTFLSVVVLSVAVSLLGPLIARIAVGALGVPLRASRVAGHLATANARANTKRVAAAVTPLALLIGMACTVFFVQTTMGAAATAQAQAGNKADWVVGSAGPGVPGDAAQRLRTVPGVTAVTEVVRTSVRVGLEKYPAQGVSTEGLTRTWDPGVTGGSLDGFGPQSVALSEVAADSLGKKPGDKLKLTLGDGTETELDVAAVYERGLGFGDLTMSHALVSRHVDNPLASSLLVKTAGDGGAGRAELRQALIGLPGVAVLDRDQVADLQAEAQQSNAEVNYVAMGLIIAFTAIAVVNTLAMSVSDRTREFALLQLVGTTRRQVMRMLRIEAAQVVLISAVLGTGIAFAVLTAFSIGMTGSASPSIDPWMYLGVLGFAAALTASATLIPGRLALAGRPADVIGSRQ
ncbi:FtsX-like permease family protein [Streptomyces sp. NBC_01351]|uniref:ABC transporter permease n=1 Tax=Streptomyces sp. NBC_01351 TaxID=2903833 RepID=UPI002E34E345|nr:FtsX-like permease family protein [Streptomyces sp. NBC_01351]